jgi:hypothetical protein
MKAANAVALALAISFAGGRVAIAAEDAASTTHPAHHDHRIHHRIPAVRDSGAGASVNK